MLVVILVTNPNLCCGWVCFWLLFGVIIYPIWTFCGGRGAIKKIVGYNNPIGVDMAPPY